MALQSIKTVEKFDPNSDLGAEPTGPMDRLRHHIDNALGEMQRFRTHIGLTDRLNKCLRLREGQYDAAQMLAIAEFGGTEVFARLGTNKVRGAVAMLRDVFIQGDRPWDIDPTPVPALPDDIKDSVAQLIQQEVQTIQAAGQPVDQAMVQQRQNQLMRAANDASRKQARLEAIEGARYIDDILVEGGFYKELNQFLLNFASYPFAVLAGPTAVMKTGVEYQNGIPTRIRKPVLTYRNVDPYDIMWAPGAMDIGNCDVAERLRFSKADLNGLIGLEGYDDNAIMSVLREYGGTGYRYDQFYEQVHEDAQNQGGQLYQSHIEVVAYTCTMCGRDLDDFGIEAPEGVTVEDDLEYQVQAWVCDRYILKAQIDIDPSNRNSYYSAAYEPVAGSIVGTALLELISDIIEAYNATLRALINNIAISSGPQVGVNRSRLREPNGQGVRVEPWMIWYYDSDPSANAGEKPVEFWQANLNAQELMAVLSFLQNMADEISGIPRYLTGSDKIGGAGRTSSGLSMLMGNATRTMTSVAGGIDEGVLEPVLQKTYDLVLLTTGTEILRGDETIVARGATYAEQRETDRMRMIEFLNSTANPFDMQILGLSGRATLLREVSKSFLKNGQEVVPPEDVMMQREAMMQQQQQMMMQQQAEQGGDPNAEQGAGPSDTPVRQGGQQPKPQQEKDPRNKAAQGTDNNFRVRSPSAIGRATRRAA